MRQGANHAGAHQGEHRIRPGCGEAGKREDQHQPDQQRLAGNTRRHCAGKQSRQGAYPAIGGDGEAHAGFRLVKIRRQGVEHAHRRQFAGDDRKGADPERNDGNPDARRAGGGVKQSLSYQAYP